MSRYRVQFTGASARELCRLDVSIRRRLLRSIAELEADPRPAGVRKLAGADHAWRIRVGDYRVIYEIHDDGLLVLVVRVAHRREVYR
ncbi:MAG: type II toxin-antitoxin system RelE/ParE family toxin [Dermatophilaceae bacterium]